MDAIEAFERLSADLAVHDEAGTGEVYPATAWRALLLDIIRLNELIEDAKGITNWHGQHSWRKRHGMPNSLPKS